MHVTFLYPNEGQERQLQISLLLLFAVSYAYRILNSNVKVLW